METTKCTFLLRMSEATRKRLRREAKKRKWSMNTYINHVIETELVAAKP